MISTQVSFRGKEVQRQPMRASLIGLAVVAGLAVGVLAGSVLLVVLMLAPVLVLMHFALRAAGRRGFITAKSFTRR